MNGIVNFLPLWVSKILKKENEIKLIVMRRMHNWNLSHFFIWIDVDNWKLLLVITTKFLALGL